MLTFNHVSTFSNSELTLLIRAIKFSSDRSSAVSSAKSRVSKFDAFGRSLTCVENNNGPKVEPCGTPHAILFCSEETLLTLTTCFLLVK